MEFNGNKLPMNHLMFHVEHGRLTVKEMQKAILEKARDVFSSYRVFVSAQVSSGMSVKEFLEKAEGMVSSEEHVTTGDSVLHSCIDTTRKIWSDPGTMMAYYLVHRQAWVDFLEVE